jgi:hypothetical protein
MQHPVFMMKLCCPSYPNCPRGFITSDCCEKCDELLSASLSTPTDKVLFEKNMDMVMHLNKQKQCFLALKAKALGNEYEWDMVQGLDKEFVIIASRWVEKNLEDFKNNPEGAKEEEKANLQRLDFYIRWCGVALKSIVE